jgi:hypothetical protein
MSGVEFDAAFQFGIMGKAMDASKQLADGFIKMMDDIPKFEGDIGKRLDVRA